MTLFRTLLFASLFGLLTGRPSHGQQYVITELVDSTKLQGLAQPLRGMGNAQMAGDKIAFSVRDRDSYKGIFIYENGKITTVVDTDTRAPDSPYTFRNLSAFDFDGKRLVFHATVDAAVDFERGLFLWENGNISRIVDNRTQAPGYGKPFGLGTPFNIASLDWPNIAFGSRSGLAGVYLWSGGNLTSIATRDTPLPGAGHFASLGGNAIDALSAHNGTVTFSAISQTDSWHQGIYGYSGGQITTIFDENTMLISGRTDITPSWSIATAEDTILFQGSATNSDAPEYFIISGTPGNFHIVADTSTPMPSPSDNAPDTFSIFDNPRSMALSDQGDWAVFRSSWHSSPGGPGGYWAYGLYTNKGGVIRNVIEGRDWLSISPRAVSGDTIVFWDNKSRFVGDAPRPSIYRADPIDTPPPVPVLPERLPDPPSAIDDTGAENLIVIAHGWIAPPLVADRSDTRAWVDDVHQRLATQLNGKVCDVDGCPAGSVADTWQIHSELWLNDAQQGIIGPNDNAIDAALLRGTELGKAILRNGYRHVHLIGHSAGAGLVARATEVITKSQLPDGPTVHTTLLDAYLNPRLPESWYTTALADAAWADHYLSDDTLTSRLEPLGSTNSSIAGVHNVDVDGLDPDLFNLEHTFPHEFYRHTIDLANPIHHAHGYGWPLSRESGLVPYDQWNPDPLFSPNTCAIELPDFTIKPTCVLARTTGIRAEDIWRAEKLLFSLGTFTPLLAHEILLSTSTTALADAETQPTPEPVAWAAGGLTLDQPATHIEFEAEFLSDVDGRLGVYWDDELIGVVGNTTDQDGLQKYLLPVISGDPGWHFLSLRLDGTAGSEVAVKNARAIRYDILDGVTLGDANLDGMVTEPDFAILADNWQADSPGFRGGDFDASGYVDINDLVTLADNWGSGVPQGPIRPFDMAAAKELVVKAPEPPGAAPTISGLIALLLCRITRYGRCGAVAPRTTK